MTDFSFKGSLPNGNEPLDLDAIYRDAERLRAEAIRNGVVAIKRWLSGLLSGAASGATPKPSR